MSNNKIIYLDDYRASGIKGDKIYLGNGKYEDLEKYLEGFYPATDDEIPF